MFWSLHTKKLTQFPGHFWSQKQGVPKQGEKWERGNMECYELAKEYYRVSLQAKVVSKKNLREVYTLIQLAITLLDKIDSNQKLLKVKSLLLKDEIIEKFGIITEDLQAGFLIDECMILLNSLHYNETVQYYKIITELKLIQKLNAKGYYKQSLKIINGSQFNGSLVYQFLRLNTFKDEQNTLAFIQTLTTDDIEVSNFLKLTEVSLCLKLGITSNVNFVQLSSNIIHLEILKQLLLIMNKINYQTPDSTIDQDLRDFAKLLSNNQSNLQIERFPLMVSGVQLDIPCLKYSKLYILFVLVLGVSSLNYSFEKRRSLKLLDQCIGLIDKELSQFNEFNSHFHKETIGFYKEVKRMTLFYTVIEHIITCGISNDNFSKFITEIGPSVESDYLKSIHHQSIGQLELSKQGYYNIINKVGHTNVLDEYYIFSCLNVLLILEGQLKYNTRMKRDNTQLNSERLQILSRLQFFTGIPHSDIRHKYLLQTTLEFISLLNNHANMTTLDINTRVTTILDNNFEHVKKFPLFCSLLLYLKSSTLNQNSDQRQKSSQIAFNLSKFGNQIMVRYVTGLLNLNNSKIARNLQQSEIQQQKLSKIAKTIDEKYSNIYDTH